MLLDKTGSKIQGYLYTPFGEIWSAEQPESSLTEEITRKFTGHYYDKESGLYYMNARYYDPDIGTFMQPDPAMQGLNHYSYCNSNPIKYVDPSGLWGKYDNNYCGFQFGFLGGWIPNNNNYGYNNRSRTDITVKTPEPKVEVKSDTSKSEATPLVPRGNYTSKNSHFERVKADTSVNLTESDLVEAKNKAMVEVNKMRDEEDSFPLQTDEELNKLAKDIGIDGLKNPKRWACYFMSSLYHVKDKAGVTMTRQDILNIGRRAYGQPDTSYPNDNRITLGNDYNVGDVYNLMNIAMEYLKDNNKITRTYRSLYATQDNAEFSINIYSTNYGEHYTAADSNGINFYDSDPTLDTTYIDTLFFRWR